MSENYDETIQLRITRSQLEELDRAARAAGVKRPEYIRQQLFGSPRSSATMSYVTRDELSETFSTTVEEAAKRAAEIISRKGKK
jgi:hypothetical protein